jgi:hypothetical protein
MENSDRESFIAAQIQSALEAELSGPAPLFYDDAGIDRLVRAANKVLESVTPEELEAAVNRMINTDMTEEIKARGALSIEIKVIVSD